MPDNVKSREKIVAFVKRRLLQNSFLRLQISLIFALTALSGFLTSFFLLQAEIYSMAFRYPFAIFVAYCIFLILLRIWLWFQKDDHLNFNIDLSGVDVGDIPIPSSIGDTANADFELEGGGDFGGGGAGGSWSSGNVPPPASVGIANTSSTANIGSKSGGSFLDSIDFDDGIWIILIIIALAGVFIAVGYVIYIAPVLFAEILLDGVLVTGLYRRVKKVDRRYWLKTAVKKTLLPAFIIAVCFGIAGYAMQQIAPEAHSIGEVWSYVLSDEN